MGKLVILIATAAILGTGMVLFQVDRSSIATDAKQADRQAQILAREIARTGHNIMVSKARKMQVQYPDTPLEDIVAQINGQNGLGITGAHGGGTYTAKLVLTSASTFAVEAVGTFQTSEHEVATVRETEAGFLAEGTLEVDEPTILKMTFLESMAGYCSAVYVQRLSPVTVAGVTTYSADTPELAFVPGNNRDGDSVQPADFVLQPGERVNFILAVDADFSCEDRGKNVPVTDPSFDYTRNALENEIDVDTEDLQEGHYAMIQEKPGSPGVWRIAFEDLYFSDAKLADVKQNGYGGDWNKRKQTYGGKGWNGTDANGYWRLSDYGDKPDFSDQVIEIEFLPAYMAESK